LVCKAYGTALPKQHGIVTSSDFKRIITELFNSNEKLSLIIKPIEGSRGHGIILASESNGKIYIRENNNTFHLDQYTLRTTCIIQEVIKQHKKLNTISNSVNTIRIVIMLTRADNVIILGAKMRFGIGDSILDNTCQGGIAVNIHMDKMSLGKSAYDNRGVEYTKHPKSNYTFEGFKIPYWEEVVRLVVKVQKSIQYNKKIGQDIAITEQGPVIIELNSEYDNVMFEQTFGPLQKNKDILKEFNDYDLLINKHQKALHLDNQL
jgi:glutathione synthase/RimK-type ligase-like ATP-grasp enzyme